MLHAKTWYIGHLKILTIKSRLYTYWYTPQLELHVLTSNSDSIHLPGTYID